MSDAKRLLTGNMRDLCISKVVGLCGTKTVDEAFAAWVLGSEYLDQLDPQSAAKQSAGKSGAERSYGDIAIMGYAIALLPELDDVKQPLIDGLKWLCGRTPFHHSATSFEVDGAGLLGIALGANAVGLPDIARWIGSFIERSASSRIAPLSRACMAATSVLIDQPDQAPMPTEEEFADFRIAFRSHGLDILSPTEDTAVALRHVLRCNPSDIEETDCAVHVRLLDWVVMDVCNMNLASPSVEDVIGILQRVPAALKRWRWDEGLVRGRPPVQWQINDEYHVQDLLWLILAPIFPELEDEESLPSLGHKHPRYDLGIPSLHLIIEVKFIRRATDFGKVTEEIAADHTLYLQDCSAYNKIVAFVWDDSASIDQHEELRQALGKMRGIAGSVIIPRSARFRKG